MPDKSLHPAWFQHEPGQQPTTPQTIDTLSHHADMLSMLGDMLIQDNIDISPATVSQLGMHLLNTARELQSLINAIEGKRPGLHSVGGES